MARRLAITTILFLMSTTGWGESLVVKDTKGFLKGLNQTEASQYKVTPVFPNLGLYKIEGKGLKKDGAIRALGLGSSAKFSSLKTFREQDSNQVRFFTDHVLTLREGLEPNDTNFTDQWALQSFSQSAGINAKEAWAITTGGTNIQGDEVVIAVVDGGFDIEHIDLKDNIWVNEGEIPGNDIDDDNNGYVDDINGWDFASSSKGDGVIQIGTHGTQVASVMGASGDNTMGMSGVNWKTKIMVVSMGRRLATTTETLAAYNYILEQKKRWLETNGREGANVVAINSSFGIDFADCNRGDYRLWNDVYNELGKYGILSAAATANRAINIDVRGDVPTGCESPYIVAVTNSTRNGLLSRFAGYGAKNIDLAAPGTDILTLSPNNKIFPDASGTSFSTPHVAGSIGLMHSAASRELVSLSVENPSKAALIMKDILLSTVSPVTSLEKNTVSGGILDLGAAALKAHTYGVDGPQDEPEDPSEEPEEEDPTQEEDSDSDQVFTSTMPESLIDYSSLGLALESTIYGVSRVNDINDLQIEVTVDHPNHEDLSFRLMVNGKIVPLRHLQDSPHKKHTYVYSVKNKNFLQYLGPSVEAGNWTLEIRDLYVFNKGSLVKWSIRIKK